MKETTQAKATAKTAFGCLKGLTTPAPAPLIYNPVPASRHVRKYLYHMPMYLPEPRAGSLRRQAGGRKAFFPKVENLTFTTRAVRLRACPRRLARPSGP